MVSFPEGIILQKLISYCLGGGVADRQWRDVLGALKVQADRLDFNYLAEWAETLNLTDLMAQALSASGLNENSLS